MRDQVEVWERRPGARWEVVYSGSADSARLWVGRQGSRRKPARFSKLPVELVVLPVGTFPDNRTEPTRVIQ